MVENVPELPDSKFQPSMPLTCVEDKVRSSIKTKYELRVLNYRLPGFRMN